MKNGLLAALALLATPPAANAQTMGPTGVAAAILQAYTARDVAAIAAHTNETNADFFAALVTGQEDPAELFGGTRGAAGTGWNGKMLPARFNGRGHAIVPFAIEAETGPTGLGSGAAGRYMAIVLTLDGPQDTSWGFEDINYIRRGDYAGMATTR